MRHAGETPDFKAPDAFDRLQKRAAELPIGAAFLFDTIIVDEGQDISDKWRDFIFRHARADARILASSGVGPAQPSAPRLSSRDLLGPAREVEIEHEGMLYRLRITALGKLILTK